MLWRDVRFLDVVIAIAAGVTQFFITYLGWKVTATPTPPKRKKLYDFLFIVLGALGIVWIGIMTYRGQMRERLHITTTSIGASAFPDMFPLNQPLRFNVQFEVAGTGMARNISDVGRVTIQDDETIVSERPPLMILNPPPRGFMPALEHRLPMDNHNFSLLLGEWCRRKIRKTC